MPSLEDICRALSLFEPRLISQSGVVRAAVAMVLRDGAQRRPEILFIERASRRGDPWSGQMAFPGGRMESGDADLRRAAERETREEVGISLRSAARLGRLDDMEGFGGVRPAGMVISAFVYHLAEPGPLVLNHEVESAFWVPVGVLRDRSRQVAYQYPAFPEPRYPGILVGEPDRHVVWGLTYRFVARFLEVVGYPLPNRRVELRPAPA